MSDFKLLSFNARSINNKFDEICAVLNTLEIDAVCISETWINEDSGNLGLYQIDGYISYFCGRKTMRGGGAMIYVNDVYPSCEVIKIELGNDAYNICAVTIGYHHNQLLLVSVYRAPWATYADTKDMCKELDKITMQHRKIVIAGDFNLPNVKWNTTTKDYNDGTLRTDQLICQFIDEHNLMQLATLPTRQNKILDLILVSSHFANGFVDDHPPIGGSDHSAQVIKLNYTCSETRKDLCADIDIQRLNYYLSLLDWNCLFTGCDNVDVYSTLFNNVLLANIKACTTYKCRTRRQRFPRHIVKLLHSKKKAWLKAKQTGELTNYIALRRTVRAAIRQHRRNLENKLVYSNNRKAFFSYVNSKVGGRNNTPCLKVNGRVMTDSEAAESFSQNFAQNFSSSSSCALQNGNFRTDIKLQQFNCTERLVLETLKTCSNSNSSPDGISYKLLKSISKHILRPLNIIFQQSLHSGIFPSVWKHSVVMPLYKGKGEKSQPTSYRPISLSSCIGKILEKIVQGQLVAYLNEHNLIHQNQHGFTTGRSTVTNMLTCDAQIADIIDSGHSYDIICFDFMKAFDKASHICVTSALARIGVTGSAFGWFSSFLTGRTQQVKVGQCYSSVVNVTSGIIQGSCLGPVLYTILIDPLIRKLRLPSAAFADDLKSVADVDITPQVQVQDNVDIVAQWAIDNDMPLSIDKCAVLHCGSKQQNSQYLLNGVIINSVNSFKDLGILRTTDGTYSEHCKAVAAKASRIAGAIRCSFQSKAPELMWPAFQAYVIPVLMYGSQVWNPLLIKDKMCLEKVQRRFTKNIRGLSALSYSDRLKELGAISLDMRRLYADMTMVYKFQHKLVNIPAASVGLSTCVSCTRGSDIRLIPRCSVNRKSAALFCGRAPPMWNKLPIQITSSHSLSIFKCKLSNYLQST